ncbi:hypothetical protein, partial [Candidatus Soleaferrea massiliensis]|uniref:hypothetical protein n=1 Tax=Candidatus Soleaferrea massiliensis TaxID=1470354 RepID=UPI001A9A58AA
MPHDVLLRFSFLNPVWAGFLFLRDGCCVAETQQSSSYRQVPLGILDTVLWWRGCCTLFVKGSLARWICTAEAQWPYAVYQVALGNVAVTSLPAKEVT